MQRHSSDNSIVEITVGATHLLHVEISVFNKLPEGNKLLRQVVAKLKKKSVSQSISFDRNGLIFSLMIDFIRNDFR